MLFLLTGEVQIGKTRWLEKLVADLAERGVPCAGVLAPGQWVASAGERADGNGYEKLGIDNVLLPDGERLPFARRGDLARADGTFDKDSQAARAELAWHISDAAIERVNAHFEKLRFPARAEADAESEVLSPPRQPGLLVVDELGRLEIWRGGGLTEAVALLREGPTTAFPHALVVVRDYLADDAEALLADAWPDRIRIAPDESGRAAVLSVARARCKSTYGDER
ncbi:hypothetical protein [Adlercreutzia caecimuris]|uniref:hypothetical protein n=1 Tax=Adlercreutzia caecimuris TaxID=671266 RepID=UPI002495579D|nr:hypothetical protein [Adlercreutzia caecimuris]